MKIKIMALCLICALLLSACGKPVTPAGTFAEPSTQPTETTTQTIEATTQPTEVTTEPTEATTQSTTPSTEPTTQPTESTTPSTEPTDTTEPTTDTTEPTTDTTEPTQSGNSDPVTYEAYQAMSPEDQQAFFESFGSYQDFIAWYVAAEAAYKESQDRNEVSGDGSLDIGDIIGGAGESDG